MPKALRSKNRETVQSPCIFSSADKDEGFAVLDSLSILSFPLRKAKTAIKLYYNFGGVDECGLTSDSESDEDCDDAEDAAEEVQMADYAEGSSEDDENRKDESKKNKSVKDVTQKLEMEGDSKRMARSTKIIKRLLRKRRSISGFENLVQGLDQFSNWLNIQSSKWKAAVVGEAFGGTLADEILILWNHYLKRMAEIDDDEEDHETEESLTDHIMCQSLVYLIAVTRNLFPKQTDRTLCQKLYHAATRLWWQYTAIALESSLGSDNSSGFEIVSQFLSPEVLADCLPVPAASVVKGDRSNKRRLLVAPTGFTFNPSVLKCVFGSLPAIWSLLRSELGCNVVKRFVDLTVETSAHYPESDESSELFTIYETLISSVADLHYCTSVSQEGNRTDSRPSARSQDFQFAVNLNPELSLQFSLTATGDLTVSVDKFIWNIIGCQLVSPFSMTQKRMVSSSQTIPKPIQNRTLAAARLIRTLIQSLPHTIDAPSDFSRLAGALNCDEELIGADSDDEGDIVNSNGIEDEEEGTKTPLTARRTRVDGEKRLRAAAKKLEITLSVMMIRVTSGDCLVSFLLKSMFAVPERKDFRDKFIATVKALVADVSVSCSNEVFTKFYARFLSTIDKLQKHPKHGVRVLSTDLSTAINTSPDNLVRVFKGWLIHDSQKRSSEHEIRRFTVDENEASEDETGRDRGTSRRSKMRKVCSGEEVYTPSCVDCLNVRMFNSFQNSFLSLIMRTMDHTPTLQSRALENLALWISNICAFMHSYANKFSDSDDDSHMARAVFMWLYVDYFSLLECGEFVSDSAVERSLNEFKDPQGTLERKSLQHVGDSSVPWYTNDSESFWRQILKVDIQLTDASSYDILIDTELVPVSNLLLGMPWRLITSLCEELILVLDSRSIVKKPVAVLVECLGKAISEMSFCANRIREFVKDKTPDIVIADQFEFFEVIVSETLIEALATDSQDQVRLRTASMLSNLNDVFTDSVIGLSLTRHWLNRLTLDSIPSVAQRTANSTLIFIEHDVLNFLESVDPLGTSYFISPFYKSLSYLLSTPKASFCLKRALEIISRLKDENTGRNIGLPVLVKLLTKSVDFLFKVKNAHRIDSWPLPVCQFVKICCNLLNDHKFSPQVLSKWKEWLPSVFAEDLIAFLRIHSFRELNTDGTTKVNAGELGNASCHSPIPSSQPFDSHETESSRLWSAADEKRLTLPVSDSWKCISQLLITIAPSLTKDKKEYLNDRVSFLLQTFEIPPWILEDLFTILISSHDETFNYDSFSNSMCSWLDFCQNRLFSENSSSLTKSPSRIRGENKPPENKNVSAEISPTAFVNALQLVGYLYYVTQNLPASSSHSKMSLAFTKASQDIIENAYLLSKADQRMRKFELKWAANPPRIIRCTSALTLAKVLMSREALGQTYFVKLIDVLKSTCFFAPDQEASAARHVHSLACCPAQQEASLAVSILLAIYDFAVKTTAVVDPYFVLVSSLLSVFTCRRQPPLEDPPDAAAGNPLHSNRLSAERDDKWNMKSASTDSRDSAPFDLVRGHALVLLGQLAAQDYLKAKGHVVFHLIYTLADSNEWIRKIAEGVFTSVLHPRLTKYHLIHIIDLICFFNDLAGHPAATAAGTALQSGFSYRKRGSKDNRPLSDKNPFSLVHSPARRGMIYSFLYKNLDPRDRVELISMLLNDFLAPFTKLQTNESQAPQSRGVLAMPASKQITNSYSVPVSRFSPEGSAMGDVFKLLASTELQMDIQLVAEMGARKGRRPKEEENATGSEIDEDGDTVVIAGTELEQEVKRAIIQDKVFPCLLSLRKTLEAAKSPLQRDVFECLLRILHPYRHQLEQVVTFDPLLLRQLQNEYSGRNLPSSTPSFDDEHATELNPDEKYAPVSILELMESDQCKATRSTACVGALTGSDN